VMIHRCQILKADLNRDFRFGPLSRASYASPALDNNEFATRTGPNEISSVSCGWFSPSDKPRLLLWPRTYQQDPSTNAVTLSCSTSMKGRRPKGRGIVPGVSQEAKLIEFYKHSFLQRVS
jgi:hypothetical protein